MKQKACTSWSPHRKLRRSSANGKESPFLSLSLASAPVHPSILLFHQIHQTIGQLKSPALSSTQQVEIYLKTNSAGVFTKASLSRRPNCLFKSCLGRDGWLTCLLFPLELLSWIFSGGPHPQPPCCSEELGKGKCQRLTRIIFSFLKCSRQTAYSKIFCFFLTFDLSELYL